MNVPQKDIKQSKKTQRNTNIPCVLDKTRNTQVNMHSRRRLSLGGRPDSSGRLSQRLRKIVDDLWEESHFVGQKFN